LQDPSGANSRPLLVCDPKAGVGAKAALKRAMPLADDDSEPPGCSVERAHGKIRAL